MHQKRSNCLIESFAFQNTKKSEKLKKYNKSIGK